MSIKLENISYVYSPGTAYEHHALKDVSLEIPQGQFVGIIGHTGSGKSTLIQHLNGLMKATSGKLLKRCVFWTEESGTFQGRVREAGKRSFGACRVSGEIL